MFWKTLHPKICWTIELLVGFRCVFFFFSRGNFFKAYYSTVHLYCVCALTLCFIDFKENSGISSLALKSCTSVQWSCYGVAPRACRGLLAVQVAL